MWGSPRLMFWRCWEAYEHLADAAGKPLSAAPARALTQCGRQTGDNGNGPVMILSLTGGLPAEAEGLIQCLNKVVAGNVAAPEVVVAKWFRQSVGVYILRGSCRAFHE